MGHDASRVDLVAIDDVMRFSFGAWGDDAPAREVVVAVDVVRRALDACWQDLAALEAALARAPHPKLANVFPTRDAD